MQRKTFITELGLFSAGALLAGMDWSTDKESPFAERLKPVGRALEMEGYYVWCNSPIMDDDGRTHVFFSRWPEKKGMGGWINSCEIGHAISENPEGPYRFISVVLSPRPGFFDATTCHNPTIKKIDGKYCLFYMGNSNGKTNTKRIGLATADSLFGPWTKPDKPLLEAGPEGAWDDHCTTNPSIIKQRNGQYWLYYKSWNTKDYETQTGPIRGNRKYGLAIAAKLEGPYIKYEKNPVIDFSGRGNNAQLEDAFIWYEKRRFNIICRDMGYYNHQEGIIMKSRDGKKWGTPETAFYDMAHYGIQQPPPPPGLKRYGRFERPQILFINNKPAYLFTTSQGGRYMTASSFIFRIE